MREATVPRPDAVVQQRVRVIYDVSTLGLRFYPTGEYDGVRRVIFDLARELATRPDVDLNLYGGRYLPETLALLRQNPSLGELIMLPSAGSQTVSDIILHLTRLVEKSLHRRALPLRAFRGAMSELMGSVRTFQARVPQRVLSQCDIFHSPVDPIPQQIKTTARIRRFLTVYDLIPRMFPSHTATESHRLLFERIFTSIDRDTFCLCISENTRRDLCNHCDVDPDKCFVTPLAASDQFSPVSDRAMIDATRAKYGIPDGPYFLSLATLEPRKNFEFTIRCFLEMLEQEKDADLHFVIVGKKGWKFDAILTAATASKRAHQRVILTGYVDDDDLRYIYSGARAFVYLSLYEGFGLPVLEAMQCGVPVITSNTSSLPEVVGDAGIMVAPNDRRGVVSAMLRVSNDQHLHQELCAKAIARARMFTWKRTADKTVAAYKHALRLNHRRM